MASRHKMSKVDTTWLRMEGPTNLMMITGVIQFSDTVDLERLKSTLEQRFLLFPRFRCKAVDHASGAFWENDADFDINSHVRPTALPGGAGRRELQEYVSELASTALDPARPRWQFHLIENYHDGPVLVMRIHHCYADGIALIQVLLSMTDTTADAAMPRLSSPRHKKNQHGVINRLLRPTRKDFDRLVNAGRKSVGMALEVFRHPEILQKAAYEGTDIVAELATAITLSDDPVSRLKGELGSRKRVAWCEPLPLDEVKTFSRALGCKVNDVLIASAAGAFNSYLKEQGDDITGLEVRATVPVNLRPLEHAKDLGNHFGLVFLNLPIGEDHPLKRLYAVKRNMDDLKSSKQAAVSYGLLAALGMGPSLIQKPALDLFSKKASMVLTNVPGPQEDLYLAGSRIEEMMFWVPQNGGIGIGISILSYKGKVQMGLIADAKLIPDPYEVIARFGAEFEKLILASFFLPDGEDVALDDVNPCQ